MKRGMNSTEQVLENLNKRRLGKKLFGNISLLSVLVIIIIAFFIIFFLYFYSPEKQLRLGTNVKSVLISEDGKMTYVKLKEGDENITKIKVIFKDAVGNEFYYEAAGKKQDYEINASDVGLEDFNNIREVDVFFEYGIGEELKVEGPTSSLSGGGGSSGGGTLNGGCNTDKDCAYYYGLDQCGSSLSDGCDNVLDCSNCSSGKVCQNMSCVVNCTNDFGCSSEGIFCQNNTPYNCSVGNDTCLDRTNLTDCGNETCFNGSCIIIRVDLLPSTAEILFASNRDTGSRRQEIYSMDSNGGNQTRITFTDVHHFVMGIDFSKRYIVASLAEIDTNPPEGLGDEDQRALWIIDLETKQETRLTDINDHAEGKSFSPDGEWIVFTMRPSGTSNPMDIYKIRKDGTELTQLTNTPLISEGDTQWSNNGDRIAFISINESHPYFILKTMDTNGNNIATIYDDEGSGPSVPGVWAPGAYDPSWNPDDEYIVFETPVEYNENDPQNFGSGIWHIFKVKTDGSQEVVDLSLLGGHADRAEYLASYSPDGKSIVFGSLYEAVDPLDSHNDIFKMDNETGISTKLTTGPFSSMYPVWIPDETLLTLSPLVKLWDWLKAVFAGLFGIDNSTITFINPTI